MPGAIIRALRDAGANNPVLMIDEIDKMGADFRGDPSSAMLEVLDPEQNNTFRDHYLDLPFDLSKVMFVCTANTLDTIPGPLRDRMEVIQLAGYTEDEKLEIAKRYLRPAAARAQRAQTRSQIAFTDPALRAIIDDYTREAGVRKLEREIGDGLPQGRDAGRGGQRRSARPTITEPRVARAARHAPVLLARRAGGRRGRASRPGSRGRRSAASAVHRGDRRCRARAS